MAEFWLNDLVHIADNWDEHIRRAKELEIAWREKYNSLSPQEKLTYDNFMAKRAEEILEREG